MLVHKKIITPTQEKVRLNANPTTVTSTRTLRTCLPAHRPDAQTPTPQQRPAHEPDAHVRHGGYGPYPTTTLTPTKKKAKRQAPNSYQHTNLTHMSAMALYPLKT